MQQKIWQLEALSVRRISVSEMQNNVYLLTSRSSGSQVLIDAADDLPAIVELIGSGQHDVAAGVRPELLAVITTHSHWDHVRALAPLVDAQWTGATERVGAREIATLAGRLDALAIEVPTSTPLDHGDHPEFGDFSLEVIHLRGHTPGSIALLYRSPLGAAHLFTGDSLFPGGVGNTQQDAARFQQLFTDVKERIFAVLPDDTIVHPGHGEETTLGAERPRLPEWQARGW
ncbi:MBL fold metallo-hydrolase [Psychromicrobium sp. YIM B11713]|uniref:MBL fold metallo-hydrolase n=1 Tax=Psychromicrobium sp. YIM B11713 TaxID=3145233 RepID=UPI00374E2C6C